MVTEYERVYPPSYTDKRDPKCPECGDPMFYVGKATHFRKGTDFKGTVDKTALEDRKLYQCVTCRRLYGEITNE